MLENIYACTFMYDEISALKSAEWLIEFSIGSVSPSPCHYILGSVSTCKHGYAENIYAWTFMYDDLSALTNA